MKYVDARRPFLAICRADPQAYYLETLTSRYKRRSSFPAVNSDALTRKMLSFCRGLMILLGSLTPDASDHLVACLAEILRQAGMRGFQFAVPLTDTELLAPGAVALRLMVVFFTPTGNTGRKVTVN